MDDRIFEMAATTVKASAFDALSGQYEKLQKENRRLSTIINTWLKTCDECFGEGVIEKTLNRGGIEIDAPCHCHACKGTGKVPVD